MPMIEDLELDPSKRTWVYDGDGSKIDKNSIDGVKKLHEDFKKYGMYHTKVDVGNNIKE